MCKGLFGQITGLTVSSMSLSNGTLRQGEWVGMLHECFLAHSTKKRHTPLQHTLSWNSFSVSIHLGRYKRLEIAKAPPALLRCHQKNEQRLLWQTCRHQAAHEACARSRHLCFGCEETEIK